MERNKTNQPKNDKEDEMEKIKMKPFTAADWDAYPGVDQDERPALMADIIMNDENHAEIIIDAAGNIDIYFECQEQYHMQLPIRNYELAIGICENIFRPEWMESYATATAELAKLNFNNLDTF